MPKQPIWQLKGEPFVTDFLRKSVTAACFIISIFVVIASFWFGKIDHGSINVLYLNLDILIMQGVALFLGDILIQVSRYSVDEGKGIYKFLPKVHKSFLSQELLNIIISLVCVCLTFIVVCRSLASSFDAL